MSPEEFFGVEAATAWRAVIDAAHQFAQLTDCLPGDDVFLWHEGKSEQFHKAVEASIVGATASTTSASGNAQVAAVAEDRRSRDALNPSAQGSEP